MNTQTKMLLMELEGLLSFEINLATRHNLPTIPVTVPRARDILARIKARLKESEKPAKQPAYFAKLDKNFA